MKEKPKKPVKKPEKPTPVVKPETVGGDHGCPAGEVWNGTKCVPNE